MSEEQTGDVSAAPEQQADLSIENQVEDQVEGSEEQTEEEVEEQIQQAKKLKKLKLKVHGQEIEEELPFEIDDNPEVVEYLTKQLQLSKAAHKAMQEKSTQEQQVKQFFQALKGNTREVLAEMGIDAKEFAAAVIEEELKKQEMTPEQIRQMELEQELENLKKEREKEREEHNKKELARLQEQEYERIDAQMTEALNSTDIPKTPYTIRKIAEYMLAGVNNGIELTPQDVVPLVREELMKDLRDVLGAIGEDAAEEFIGKELINKVRKRNVAKAKPQTPATLKAGIKDVNTAKKAEPKQSDKSYKDFFGF